MNLVQDHAVAGMSQETIRMHGDELFAALRNRAPVSPLSDRAAISIDDAYAIQMHVIARRLEAEGERIVGKKIGLTSKAVQTALGVDQPDFGHLLASMAVREADAVPMDSVIAPRAEGEIAFLLKRGLEGPGLTGADILYATECVMPCFEIVDSRIIDWKIEIEDTIADNASAGAFVVGDAAIDPRRIDLALVGMTIEKNGEVATTGAGAAALGHPVNAVTWLANRLGELGVPLRAGEIILSGSLGALIPVAAGDHLRMTLGGIGSVSTRFS